MRHRFVRLLQHRFRLGNCYVSSARTRSGRLKGVKIGRRRLITLAAVEDLIANGDPRLREPR
ncbi:MAG: hypothetical protein K0U84_22230 [Actinomycetia bacterium]|nr:hypothetical protein [Actinomycetes bacterium]